MEFFLLGGIFLLSTFVQGFTSFGFSLVAIPLLMLFWNVKLIVVVTMTYSLVINSLVVRKFYKFAKFKKILPLIITAILFTFVGINFLQNINEFILKLIVGILLILVGIINNLGISFNVKNTTRFFIPIGIVSGILNGISGISGPPVLMFLSNIKMTKEEFKATLSCYFFILNVVAIVIYFFKGFYDAETINYILKYVVFVVIGTSIGIFTSIKTSEKLFKKIINIAIPILGVNMLIKLFA